jgi:lipoprotein-anchoring transpeptidase ErfK/SrfK
MSGLIAVLAIAISLGALTPAQANILITVDKSTQRLSVSVDGINRYEFPVSTARIGYYTPDGTYRPERPAVKYFSRKYDWSPMPHSIFFHGGYAIHGSYGVSHLGSPASHGCIRLHPDNATVLYDLVKDRVAETQIVITGEGDGRNARPMPVGFENGFFGSVGNTSNDEIVRRHWRV